MALTEKQKKALVEALKDSKNDKKTLAEIVGFDHGIDKAAYDRWKTSVPDSWNETEMLDKDDFMSMVQGDHSNDKEFLDWVEEPEDVEKIKSGIEQYGSAIESAIAQGILSWEEICSEFFDIKPVKYYPGDLDEAKPNKANLNESKNMKKFNYKEYIQDNWLLKEAKEFQLTPEFWKRVCLKNNYTPLEEPHPNKEYDNLSLEGKVRADSGMIGLFRVCTGNRPGYQRGWTFYRLVQSPGSGKTWAAKDSGTFEEGFEEAKGQPATTADLKGFATKDATLRREKRAQQGNWEGSVGKYVEDHRAEIDAAAQRNELRAYIAAVMKPALSPEAQEYVDKLLAGYASSRQLHQALYNILLKGNGLGLHEEAGEEGAKGRFMDAISNVQDFGENDDQDFEIDINGHHISVQYDWGAWDRPNYDTIKVDGKGLSFYDNDDPMFDELAAGLQQ